MRGYGMIDNEEKDTDMSDNLTQAHKISELAQKLAYALDNEEKARKEFVECNEYTKAVQEQLTDAVADLMKSTS